MVNVVVESGEFTIVVDVDIVGSGVVEVGNTSCRACQTREHAGDKGTCRCCQYRTCGDRDHHEPEPDLKKQINDRCVEVVRRCVEVDKVVAQKKLISAKIKI